MKKFSGSKNRIFLLEITINILLFSALLIVGLMFFIKTHTLTTSSGKLHQAVNICCNIASLYEQDNGNFNSIASIYPNSINTHEKLFIYFDNEYSSCDKEQAIFKVVVTSRGKSSADIAKADIAFLDEDNSTIYELTACSYTPLTPNERIGEAK